MARKQATTPEVIERGGRKYARNQSILARELHVVPMTIKRWAKQPGCPGSDENGRYDIESWREWRQTMPDHSGPGAPRMDLSQSEEERYENFLSKTKLQEMKLQEEIRKLQLQSAELEGTSIPIDEAIKVFSEMASAIKDGQAALCHNIARDMAGCDVPEATKRIKEACLEILRKWSLGEWAKKKAFWSRLYAMQFDLLGISPRGSGASSTASIP